MSATDRFIKMKNHPRLKDFISDDVISYLWYNGFFTAPASTKYHGSYEGGLFDHSYAVMEALEELTDKNNLEWMRDESPYIVGLFHDLCKIDSYRHPVVREAPDGNKVYDESTWEHNKDVMFKGHGDKSIILLSQLMMLTEEEIACIRYHMGAFTDKEEWRDYTNAVHAYENVLWTHHADMLASHVAGI